MQYKITIETTEPIEGKDYPKIQEIYRRIVDDLDIKEVAKVVEKINPITK